MRSLWPRLQRRPEIVLITDPGPDPDDAKTLLILATLHRRGVLGLRAVVCNGGGEPAARARLALCLLRHLGVDDVPVGVGSAGVPSRPEPHEYMLQGYDDVEPADLAEGSALLRATLGAARARQLTVVCISGLRDFADVFLKAPELLASVGEVAIQGGLERADGTPWGWAPDTSVNNTFDAAAAATVYDGCFGRGIPMSVVSREAVPLVPMQLARSFAVRMDCPVMHYLASAQFLGLVGLWQRLCRAQLPARCTKQWFFETFCAVGPAEFAQKRLDALGEDDDILPHLNGFVKPYDVVALMAVLPSVRQAVAQSGGEVRVRGVSHRLLISPEQLVPHEAVLWLLRSTFHDVVALTAEAASARAGAHDVGSSWLGAGARARLPSTVLGHGGGAHSRAAVAPRSPSSRSSSRHSQRSSAHAKGSRAPRLSAEPMQPPPLGPGASSASSAVTSAGSAEEAGEGARGRRRGSRAVPSSPPPHSPREIAALLGAAHEAATGLNRGVAACLLCAAVSIMAVAAVVAIAILTSLGGGGEGASQEVESAAAASALSAPLLQIGFNGASVLCVLALQPVEAQRALVLASALLIGGISVGLVTSELIARAPGARGAADILVKPDWSAGQATFASVGHASWALSGLAMLVAAARLHTRCARLLRAVWLCLAYRLVLTYAAIAGYHCVSFAEAEAEAAGRARSGGAAVLAAMLAIDALGLGLGLNMLRPAARARVQYAVGRALGRASPLAALDALAGGAGAVVRARRHGGARRASARRSRGGATGLSDTERVRRALAVFQGLALSAEALDAACDALVHARARARAVHPNRYRDGSDDDGDGGGSGWGARGAGSWRRSSASDGSGRAGQADGGIARAVRLLLGGPGRSGGLGAKHAAFNRARAAPHPHTRPSLDFSSVMSAKALLQEAAAQRAAAGGGGGGARGAAAAERAASPPVVDAYVVHALADSGAGKGEALRRWAAEFERLEGRAPTVWIDVLCADPALTPEELLAHTPIHLARARRLLLLAGPHLCDCTWAACVLFAWRALGGSADTADVALIPAHAGGAPGETVAAFDAFHVLRTHAMRRAVAEADGGADEPARPHALVEPTRPHALADDVHDVLRHAIELAGVHAFNDAVHAHVPRVRGAADAMQRAHADAPSAPPTPPTTTSAAVIPSAGEPLGHRVHARLEAAEEP